MNLMIRKVRLDDAEQIIQYVRNLTEEPDINILLSPGEFTLTIEQEQERLSDFTNSDNSIYLVAEIDTKIIGILTCKGGTRRAVRHAASLSISVAKEWRNQGIGNLLLSRAIEWAKSTGIISRIELDVFTRNQPAIHLYQKFGFVIEGQRHNAIYRDGKYYDNMLMALLL